MPLLSSSLYDRFRLNFFLYPGIIEFRGPHFLAPYYEWRRGRLGQVRIVVNALFFAFFWVWIPRRARKAAKRWSKPADWPERIIPLARKWMTDPFDLAIFDIEDEATLALYQRRMEQVGVTRVIESATTDHSAAMLDKQAFQSACEERGLRVPTLYALVHEGEIEQHQAPGNGTQLLAKPTRGSGGKGIVQLAGEELGDPQLAPTRFPTGTWLVQEKVEPHSDIADLALDALPTVRIVTILDEGRSPEIVAAALRFPVVEAVAVDNGHAGGLIAPVDLESGILDQGLSGWAPGHYDHHPINHGPITGRALPDWQAARELAVAGHRDLFPEHVIIGWDVGIAKGGPVLIEANQRPAVRLTQRAAGKGIGAMRYGELINHHLREAISKRPDREFRMLDKG